MTKCHLSWDSYQKNISSGLAVFQQQEEFVDMTLAAAGHLVKVHKNLLALASPYIKAMIQSAPCPHPVIFLSNINEETLGHILEYVYTGEVLMPTQKMDAFLKACQDLHILGVQNVIRPKLPPDYGDKVTNEGQQQQTNITSYNILSNAKLLIEATKAKKRKLDQYDEDIKIAGTNDNSTLENIDINTGTDSVDQNMQLIDQKDEIAKVEAITTKAESLRKMTEQNDATEIEVDLMEDPIEHKSRVKLVEDRGLIESETADNIIKMKTCDVTKTSDQSLTKAPDRAKLAINVAKKRKYVKKKIIPQRCYTLRRSQINNDDKQKQETERTQIGLAENEHAVISKIIVAQKASDIKIKKINDTFRLVTNSDENITREAVDDATVSENVNPAIERKPTQSTTDILQPLTTISVDIEENIGAHVIDANTDVTLQNNIHKSQTLDPVTDLPFIPTNIVNENVTSRDPFPLNYIENNQAFDTITDLPLIPTIPINEIDTNNSIDYTINNKIFNSDIDPSHENNYVDEPFDYMDVETSINNEFTDQISTYGNNIIENTDQNNTYANYIIENTDQNNTYANYIIENTDQKSTYTNDIIKNTDQNSSHENTDQNNSVGNDMVVKAMNKCKTYEDCVKELIEDPSTNEETITKGHSDSDLIPKTKTLYNINVANLDPIPNKKPLYNVNVELPGGSQGMPKITVLSGSIQNKSMPVISMENIPVSDEEESTWKHKANLMSPKDLITGTAPLFMVNGFRRLQMIFNRYIYSIHHTTRLRWRWRCIDYRHKNCRAYVDTEAGDVVGRVNAHQHPFHDEKIIKIGMKKRVFSSLKEIQEIVGQPMEKLIYLDLGFLNDLPES